MSEERMNPNFDLESCLRNKVNEAKRYLEDKHKRQKDVPCEESSYAESFIYYFQNVETILDLYQHKKGRVEELKKELLQEKEKNKELEKKYERVRAGRNWLSERISAQIATPELFDKIVEENYISKDKIRAKIKELENLIETNNLYEECWNKIEVLKELLEEE